MTGYEPKPQLGFICSAVDLRVRNTKPVPCECQANCALCTLLCALSFSAGVSQSPRECPKVHSQVCNQRRYLAIWAELCPPFRYCFRHCKSHFTISRCVEIPSRPMIDIFLSCKTSSESSECCSQMTLATIGKDSLKTSKLSDWFSFVFMTTNCV